MESEGEPPNELPIDRKAPRFPVEFEAVIRKQGGGRLTVLVYDLSTHGFRIAPHADLPVGSLIWIKVPGLESLAARVAWGDYEWAGCEFTTPLHPAVLDRLVQAQRYAPSRCPLRVDPASARP